MTRNLISLGLLSAVYSMTLAPLTHAEEPKPSRPLVVLIGISNYADKQINARVHAEEDAQALYDLFVDKQYLGVGPSRVRLLLGSEDAKRKSQPATRENILKAVEWLASEAAVDDLAILVFIGEGGPLGEKSDRLCYFARDSIFKERNKTAIAAADVRERLEKLKSRHFCAFVDINFKGYTVTDKVIDPTLENVPYREFLGDDGTELHGYRPGRVAFLATNGLSASLDLKTHGLFTHALLAGFQGEADTFGYEPDGIVTIHELVEYLGKEMPALANKFGKTDQERGQTHHVLGDRNDHFPLTHNPRVTAQIRQRLDKLNELIADKKITEEMGAEGRQLLRQMPPLKAHQALRKEYQKLVDGKLTAEKLVAARKDILDSVKLDREAAEKFAAEIIKATKLLKEDYVKKVDQGELVGWAIRGLYRRLDEKVPQEFSEKIARAKSLKETELKELLIEARLHLGKREDLKGQKDVDIALQRMLRQLDPYTTFIDPETLERFRRGTEGAFTGIGVQIKKDADSGFLLVTTPLKGSPAYKIGVKAGDLITTIVLVVDKKGKKLEKPEEISTKTLSTSDAVTRIVGPEGTPVKIKVKRPGVEKEIEYEIVRGRVELESVLGSQRKPNDDWDFLVDRETRIGYIRLTQFTRNSHREMARAMKELKKEGLKGLVLDLRFNPGGLLYIAQQVSDLFIDDGLIVSIRPREGKEDRLVGYSEGSYLDFPMVCLVNGGSASGSEIVAACLQDHGRAIIMGERSYGKGSVQNVMPFAGGEMKMTTASFWRPSGKNLNKSSTSGREEDDWGVKPDKGYSLILSRKETEDLEEYQHETEIITAEGKPVKMTNPDYKDRQLEMALKYLRTQINLASLAKSKKAG